MGYCVFPKQFSVVQNKVIERVLCNIKGFQRPEYKATFFILKANF